jgi:hypothetical protein
MSVNNLDNPEKGMNLANRDPKGAKDAVEEIDRVKKGKPSLAAELEGLRERIAAARELTPETVHCSDCSGAFAAGRDAAIKAIEGE